MRDVVDGVDLLTLPNAECGVRNAEGMVIVQSATCRVRRKVKVLKQLAECGTTDYGLREHGVRTPEKRGNGEPANRGMGEPRAEKSDHRGVRRTP